MKTGFKKLRGFGFHKHEAKDRRDLQPLAQLDELAQASQDMQDVRDFYDSLLSAAAATTNTAYEFSVSLRDMGACLLEKTALNDDEESGRVLLMLGKAQFRLRRLIDGYRSHISQTITKPSESLLNELRTVEEMKRQCDEKRELYDYMRMRQTEKGRSKNAKRETFSLQQLQSARDEYDEEAALFVFRLKSLKQGQSRSLLTQAARHHAAQLCFFKKALKSLEAVEPHVKSVAEQQHIDYQFPGLEDDDGDEIDDAHDFDDFYDENDDGELSFDYGQNDRDQDLSTSRNSMELDQPDLTFPQVDAVNEDFDRFRRSSFSFKGRTSSQSAPLLAENRFEPPDITRQTKPSSARKFHTYVLPTPVDAKSAISTGSRNTSPLAGQTGPPERKQNLWHSSPLEPRTYEKLMKEVKTTRNAVASAQSVLKESNNNAATPRPLPPLADGLLYSRSNLYAASDAKKIRRLAFSGPLSSKARTTNPYSMETPHLFSGPLLRNPIPQPTSPSPGSSPVASPNFVSSPKISELHELPRPPSGSSPMRSSRPSGPVGYSAPLASKGPATSVLLRKTPATNAASPLPTPPETLIRSFSIPSRGLREALLQQSKTPEARLSSVIVENVSSPPLTPIALSKTQPLSSGSAGGIPVVLVKGAE